MTLVLYHDSKNSRILLGQHKRGPGKGKWNGFGGKVEDGETLTRSARRELFEEANIIAGDMEKVGVLEFEDVNFKKEIWEVHFFRIMKIYGDPRESEEMRPRWFGVDFIPYKEMWDDDKYWMPLFLEGKNFSGKFLFDTEGSMISHEININKKL